MSPTTKVRVALGAIPWRFADGRAIPLLPFVGLSFEKDLDKPPEFITHVIGEDKGKPHSFILLAGQHADRLRSHADLQRLLKVRDAVVAWLSIDDDNREDFETFQRLTDLWGHFFLRIVGPNGYVDYQVMESGGRVYPQATPIEHIVGTTLLVATPKREDVHRALARSLFQDWQTTQRSPVHWHFGEAKAVARRAVELFERLGGPLPWTRWPGDIDEGCDLHTVTIGNFEQASSYLRSSPAQSDRPGSARLAELFREAHIFELSSPTYAAIYQAVNKYTCEAAGIRWPGLEGQPSPDEVSQYVARTTEAATRQPYPAEKLPFDVCYIGWGKGLPLRTAHLNERGLPSADVREARVFGWVLSRTGWVYELIWATARTGRISLIWCCHRSPDKGWTRPLILLPWMVNTVILGLNDHRTVAVEGVVDAGVRKPAPSKPAGPARKPPLPPPYYLVYMRSEVILNHVQRTAGPTRAIDWQHRWRVRGHDVARVRRGPQPMRPEVHEKLIRYGYQLVAPDLYLKHYDPERANAATVNAVLAMRNMPGRKPNEWMSVAVGWYPDAVKGPADKPLIDSVHRPMEMPGMHGVS